MGVNITNIIHAETNGSGILALVIFSIFFVNFFLDIYNKRLRWSGGSVLAFGTQVRGFKPGRSRRFFGRKNPQCAFLRRGSKAVGLMS